MHVSLPISAATILMGSDSSETYGNARVFGSNMALLINTDFKENADKLFGALTIGGKVNMPMEDTFWGAYFGMFTDKFGIHWMVDFDANPQK